MHVYEEEDSFEGGRDDASKWQVIVSYLVGEGELTVGD
jgi:hypothetical protein